MIFSIVIQCAAYIFNSLYYSLTPDKIDKQAWFDKNSVCKREVYLMGLAAEQVVFTLQDSNP